MKIFSQTSLRRHFIIVSIALIATVGRWALSQNDEAGTDCLECHSDVYEKELSNFYIHPPFEKKQCDKCHLKQGTARKVSDSISTEISHPVVLSYPEHLAEHTILLKGLIPRAVYDINGFFEDMSGNKAEEGFTGLVPENIRNVKRDDKEAPNMSEVKVGPIVKGIFLQTAITWQTDEPATSWVEYGLSDQYGKRTAEDNALVKHHGVSIYELEGGKHYHFRVRSRDMFGNESVSEDMVFNTEKISSVSEIKEGTADAIDESALDVNRVEIFLLNSDLGLYFETTKPASVRIEYVKVEEPPAEELPQIQAAAAAATSGDSHEELRDGKGLRIDACYQCHPPEDLGVSHPVGIGPSEKTKIPDDLPTLEGGIITCVTCHDVHGSSRRYFARKKVTKDVCISCHEGY